MDKEINTDKKISSNNSPQEEVDVLAVSMKPSPILKGVNAKKLLDEMAKPKDNTEFFNRCKETSKKFKVVK
jgi:hypothetical protein